MSDRYAEARDLVLSHGKPSPSFVSRILTVPYSEAAGYLERMERDGLVSGQNNVGIRKMLSPST